MQNVSSPPVIGGMLYADTRFIVKTFNKDISEVDVDAAYTGYGFSPKAIIIFGAIVNSKVATWGLSSGAGVKNQVIFAPNNAATPTTGYFGAETTWSIVFMIDTSNYIHGEILSFDADGFTIRWGKTGTPIGTANIKVIAFR